MKYRHWAQAQLARVKRGGKKVGKPVKKKPYLLGKVGAYYDSNPLLVPDAEADAGLEADVEGTGSGNDVDSDPADGLSSGGLL